MLKTRLIISQPVQPEINDHVTVTVTAFRAAFFFSSMTHLDYMIRLVINIVFISYTLRTCSAPIVSG